MGISFLDNFNPPVFLCFFDSAVKLPALYHDRALGIYVQRIN
ncbi:hypothetical protein C8D90_101529 [Enterobacillus tribolii]|uniref:Uncharacterized protein n=1 Tax=Enterobacillus tribolii TaxID=1487935 RepID=A0A370R3S8_9GAMM|nr:hypothetical protein C8D90_101529 [Enterobacillus tribolii]